MNQEQTTQTQTDATSELIAALKCLNVMILGVCNSMDNVLDEIQSIEVDMEDLC